MNWTSCVYLGDISVVKIEPETVLIITYVDDRWRNQFDIRY